MYSRHALLQGLPHAVHLLLVLRLRLLSSDNADFCGRYLFRNALLLCLLVGDGLLRSLQRESGNVVIISQKHARFIG